MPLVMQGFSFETRLNFSDFASFKFSRVEYAVSAITVSISIPFLRVFATNSGNSVPSNASPEVIVAAVIIRSSLIAMCVL